jgi:hypothetical protein
VKRRAQMPRDGANKRTLSRKWTATNRNAAHGRRRNSIRSIQGVVPVLLYLANRKLAGSGATTPPEPDRSSKFTYLRAAQAYMLISMPTDTSTIFGVFQVIRFSQQVLRDVALHQS